MSIFIDPTAPRVGLRVLVDQDAYAPMTRLVAIEARVVVVGSQTVYEMSTSDPSLFAYFYAFALAVADLMQLDHVSLPDAVEQALTQWRTLVRLAARLSEEEQTGLAGELWVLERLAGRSPDAALRAWTGPLGEAHDFRIGNNEFEVKSTRGERRVHTINGLGQLVASPERRLFMISLQFTSAGASGESLGSRLEAVDRLMSDTGHGGGFESQLRRGYGITVTDALYYRDPLQLRSAVRVIPITSSFPSITPDDVASIERDEMNRVSDVHYRLDVSGFGFEDGSPDFAAIVDAESLDA